MSTESKSKVSIRHPSHIKMSPQWKKCRVTSAGQKAVHDAGTDYLPKLSGQDDTKYNAYKSRAQFFNAVWSTVKVMVGMLMRKAPTVEVPGAVKALMENITGDGKDFDTFCTQIATEMETVGRVGILVDHPPVDAEGLTVAVAERMNLRPTMNYYKTESITNWKRAIINNKRTTVMVTLHEMADISTDEFSHDTEERYRVLDLINVEDEKTGDTSLVYRVRVFKVVEGEDILLETRYPLLDGEPLSEIPFFFISTDDTTPEVEEPPLIDLVDCALAWYRLDADLKHGLHFTGLPTPVVTGHRIPDGDKLCIGSTEAWVFAEPDADAKYLEFEGQGLSAISTEKDKQIEQMAVLGSRHIGVEKKDSETAQTAQIHRAGEDGSLSSIAVTMGTGMTQALRMFCAWAGSPSETVLVTINKDFVSASINPQELIAWVGAVVSGSMSPQVFFWNLQQKEAIPPDLTFEEHQAQLESGSRII